MPRTRSWGLTIEPPFDEHQTTLIVKEFDLVDCDLRKDVTDPLDRNVP